MNAQTRSVSADEATRAVAELHAQGYCVIPGVLTAAEVDQLRKQLDAVAAQEGTAGTAWFSHRNQRVFMLLNKGACFLELIDHALALTLAESLLGKHLLLSSLTANTAAPGNRPQPLHADQGYLPTPWLRVEATNLIWALDEFNASNGATRIVPGSHHLDTEPLTDESPTVPIEAPAGSLVCLDGRVWHGTGVNRTEHPRRALFAYYCRPYLRQQENFSRSLHLAIRRNLTSRQRELLGFEIWQGLGAVNGLPVQWMDGRERVGPSNADILGDFTTP